MRSKRKRMNNRQIMNVEEQRTRNQRGGIDEQKHMRTNEYKNEEKKNNYMI